MAKILTQEEVDALLNSVQSGGDAAMDDDPGDAPSAGMATGIIEREKPKQKQYKKVMVYNFKRPDRVSKEQMRSLHFLHDRFARNFSSSLSAYLRTISEINLVSVEQLTYSEFLLSLPDPTCFSSIAMKPLEGNAALEINPSLVFPIIDKMLGGPGEPLTEIRAMTAIEQNIFEAILRLILEDLKEVWKQIVNLDMRIHAQETSPQLVQVVAPNEVVVLIVFEVKFQEVVGMMNFCIPSIILEPIAKEFDQEWYTGYKKSETFEEAKMLSELMKRVYFDVGAEIRGSTITVQDFLSLERGDIIELTSRPEDPLMLSVNHVPKYQGQVLINNEVRAFQVHEKIEPL
ncbi:flagellar motor switch protein FliM [Acanthopleuribacter pedis]|uniref:Flagellar motor switch protein FliM n=1 Tax=Acanthopleuribacter pedis TaxID=442870 RepID=A0A8J7QB79_9BACT|nr:flagellar motor switch protein FliM [Acanthopleuribacter pedis]MBO1322927.1 flagellar motor switch protein FliM [Acanthopleuribacter pedis]